MTDYSVESSSVPPALNTGADFDVKAAKLASGLFVADLPFIFLTYPLLVCPAILAATVGGITEQLSPTLLGAERILGLVFTLLVCLRWRRKLEFQHVPLKGVAIVSYFFFGVGVWLAWLVPTASMDIGSQVDGAPISNILLLVCASAISIRYYFYFVSFTFGAQSLGDGLSNAASIVRQNWYLPFKATIAPVGVMLLATGFASAPYPDGRHWQFVAITEACGGLYWVLSTYLGLAYGLLLLDGRTWHLLKLDPYREPRFESITKEAKPFVSRLFSPKNGVTLLVLSILVWFGNMIRVTTTPPPMSVEVVEATAEESRVHLSLRLVDDKFHFHGVYPKLFSLAGESGTKIAGLPDKVIVKGSHDSSPPLTLQGFSSPVDLSLEFSTDRSGRALTELKDLYLWYRGVRIKSLTLKEKE